MTAARIAHAQWTTMWNRLLANPRLRGAATMRGNSCDMLQIRCSPLNISMLLHHLNAPLNGRSYSHRTYAPNLLTVVVAYAQQQLPMQRQKIAKET